MRPAGGPAYPRLAITGIALATLAVCMALRVLYLTLSPTLKADAAQVDLAQPIAARRGSIWDRRGALLAGDTFVYDAGLNTAGLDEAALAEAAAQVAPRFGLDAAWILKEQARVNADFNANWVGLANGLTLDQVTAMRQAQAAGDASLEHVEFSRQPSRIYPLGADGLAVLGMMLGNGLDENGQATKVGSHGIEASFDTVLAGAPGRSGGLGKGLAGAYRPARPGMDLRLTIDRELQQGAAAALRETVRRQGASGGTVMIMDSRSGALLASVSEPSFDPNDLKALRPDALRDPAVSLPYEPGSVMKVVTVAAGLEQGAVREDSHYQDDGVIEVAGMTVRNWDRLAHGWTSMERMLQDSLNVGAVWVALQTGQGPFYAAVDAFGFGEESGVDLAAESQGTVHHPGDPAWYDGFLASNSYGHGIEATPLQVLAAVNAVANDGVLLRPYVVAERIPAEGPSLVTEPLARRQVMSAANAAVLRRLLRSVVDNHATAAAVPGYSIGGKTGTTELINAELGRYDDHATIASFCGFLPVERPVVTICAKVDRPDGQRGSEVAAPLFGEVARQVVRVLRIPPDRPDFQQDGVAP